MAATREHALNIAVAASRTYHMSCHHQAWASDQSGINRVTKVDSRPLWIERAHVAKSGEAVAHILLRVMEPGKRLDRSALQRLTREI